MTLAVWLAATCIASGIPAPDGVEFKMRAQHLAKVSFEIRSEMAGLHYLFNPYQLKYFFDLPDDNMRRVYIENFWKSKDPTPTTPDNPMRELHDERIKFVQTNYGIPDWPGWDDRGHMYVRYGAPDYRGRIASTISPHGVDLGVWLWYYEKHNMLVAFEYFKEIGPHHFATSHLGVARFMTPQLIEFLLYDANPAYEGYIPIGILEPEYATKRGILGHGEGRDPGFTDTERDHLEHLGRKMEYSTKEVLHDVLSSYPFNFEPEAFPFYFDIVQFKAGNDNNRIEVNVEFPIGQSADAEVKPVSKQYDLCAAFFRSSYSEVTRREQTINIGREVAEKGRRLWPAQFVATLERDYYRVAISVENDDRSSSYWSNVTIKDFYGGLAVSDILFASTIGEAKDDSPFNRGSLKVVPHPARMYRKGDALPVYFEIYNLRIQEKLSSYEISYRIVAHTRKKSGFWDEGGRSPAVASSFAASGYNSDEPLHLIIHTENLKPGTYDFLITITDLIALDTVRRAAAFKVVDKNFELAR